VADQLSIAGGRPLQERVTFDGHAIECRLTAEDDRMRPSPGTGARFAVPEAAGLRVDTHIEDGARISPYYDSLMAKLIAHGADREEAVGVLRAALDGLHVEGVATNRALLASVLAHPDFATGAVTTNWLEAA
jgi:acetyl-CoA carboxylase, biotin carboxylase subunit